MPTFTPPLIGDIPRVLPDTRGPARLLMRHYSPGVRGRSVLKIDGTWTTVDIPTTDQLVAAGEEGVDWFLGGHVYTVTQDTADALADAGYVVDDYTPTASPLTGFGYGRFGEGEFGG
jgi:hypothetical protein